MIELIAQLFEQGESVLPVGEVLILTLPITIDATIEVLNEFIKYRF